MTTPIDLTRVKTIPLGSRSNKVELDRFASPPQPNRSVREFVAALPQLLAGNDFTSVVEAIVSAHREGRQVVIGLGAHVIKCGLSPVVNALIERGIVTAIAMNGATAIHDAELALIGETSEDVQAGLREGTFGMVRETGELYNRAAKRSHSEPDAGLGRLIADELIAVEAPNRHHSLLVTARRAEIPATVHVAIGTDIVHMHGCADGAALGQSSFTDFRLLSSVICELSGGVYVNAGSAVLLPEVFLKAFTVAQNLGAKLEGFTTVNMDMMAHYRAGENVVRRPPSVGGRGYTLLGRHEIMIPLLAQAVVDRIAEDDQ